MTPDAYTADRDEARDLRAEFEPEYREAVRREVAEDHEASLRNPNDEHIRAAIRYLHDRIHLPAGHPNTQRADDELAGRRETPGWVRGAGWGS